MVDSGYFPLNQLPERSAFGYMVDARGNWKTNHYNLPIIGASDGGAFTTVADMVRLWQGFVSGKLLSPELTSSFQNLEVRTYQEEVSYGLGLYLWQKYTPPALFIVGSDAGVGFDSRHFPQHDLTIMIFSNVTDRGALVRERIYDNLQEIIPL